MIFTIMVIISTLLGIQVNGDNIRQPSNRSTVPKPSPIFNGDLAYEHEFKYIVGIGEVNHYFSGAGIVLNEYWILTCRHVVIQQNINKDTLYFNFTSKGPLHVWPKYYNDIRKTVSEKLPRYSPAKMFCLDVPNDANPQYWTDSDLALIKLQTPLKLYQQDKFNLQRIKFQNKDMFTDFSRGYDVRIAGWGKLFPEQDDMQPTYRLRTAKMANEERWADRNLDFARYPAYRPSRQIPLRFRKNACVGDSGGPAVLTTVGTGEESLMGVMTWVSNPMCKDITFITNMGYLPYRQWIDVVMKLEPTHYFCEELKYVP